MKSPLLADLLPLPRECRFTGYGFRLGPKLRLWHTVAASESDRRAAAILANTVPTQPESARVWPPRRAMCIVMCCA